MEHGSRFNSLLNLEEDSIENLNQNSDPHNVLVKNNENLPNQENAFTLAGTQKEINSAGTEDSEKDKVCRTSQGSKRKKKSKGKEKIRSIQRPVIMKNTKKGQYKPSTSKIQQEPSFLHNPATITSPTLPQIPPEIRNDNEKVIIFADPLNPKHTLATFQKEVDEKTQPMQPEPPDPRQSIIDNIVDLEMSNIPADCQEAQDPENFSDAVEDDTIISGEEKEEDGMADLRQSYTE
jgi:hypothetical protein